VRRHLNLISPREALQKVHWPEPGEIMQDLQSSRTPAHIRLIFEELFFVELGLELKRREQKAQTGIAFKLDDRARAAIRKILPFHPTAAQKRVLKEIASDMEKPYPMRRLLQGDVGSGKTIVAFEAAIIAIENGYQVALMAPTEILAQQHYFSARRILERRRLPRRAAHRLNGGRPQTRNSPPHRPRQCPTRNRNSCPDRAKGGVRKLGMVIVDEQHRFGVLQRFKLMKKIERRSCGDGSSTRPGRGKLGGRARAGCPGHDRNPNPAHSSAHALRRSRRKRDRRNAARANSDHHALCIR